MKLFYVANKVKVFFIKLNLIDHSEFIMGEFALWLANKNCKTDV